MTKNEVSEVFEGVAEFLNSMMETYSWTPLYFECSDLPSLMVFSKNEGGAPSFEVVMDLETDCFRVQIDGRDANDPFDFILSRRLSFTLYDVLFAWIFAVTAEYLESEIDEALNEERLAFDSDFKRWAFAVYQLSEFSQGEFFPSNENHGVGRDVIEANRIWVQGVLPSAVDKFWSWTRDFEHEFGRESIHNHVQMLKARFSDLGFPENYEFDPFEVAKNSGEDLAEAMIGEVMRRKAEKEAQPQPPYGNSAVAAGAGIGIFFRWVIPIGIGIVIAVGAAAGY